MIAVPFIYFIFLLLFFRYKQKAFNIGSVIVSIYAFSAFCSILVDIFDLYGMGGVGNKNDINPFSVFTYCLIITICILPFYKFRSDLIRTITLSNPKLFDYISYFFMFVFSVTILSIFSDLRSIIVNGDLGALRSEFYMQMSNKVEAPSLIGYIPYLFAQYSPLALLFYFYSICFLSKPKWFNNGLILSSLTSVATSILQAGRFAVIYWIMMVFIFYVLFRSNFKKNRIRKLYIQLLILGGIIFLYLVSVTIARFSNGNDTGAQNSLIAYIGQPYINFCNIFQDYHNNKIVIGRIMPFTSSYILHQHFEYWDYIAETSRSAGLLLNVFYTFIGEVFVDLGFGGMLLYIFIFVTISYIILKRKDLNSINFSQLVLLVVLVRIPYQGIFAIVYTGTPSTYYVWGSILFYFLLKHTFKFK